MNIQEAKKNMEKKGFLDMEIDVHLNLFEEINKLKKEKNAIVLAHYYQEADIQDVADYLGDSLGLAQKAQSTHADMIVFAGVHFMAETAKILNPTKKVVLPDLKAGCSLADSAPAPLFKAFKERHPDHIIISYINCTAEIKALSDIICTSSNAEAIVNSLPAEQKIIFAPDKNLGAYLNKKTGREMLLWNESFPQSPEDRIGMLFWRMHRCARITFSLNYHMGKWSPQQCIDFLIDRVGHERANAEGEVRRSFVGGYNPLYQVGYMIGGLQVMALKNEIVNSKKMSLKEFHDAVMLQNSMPSLQRSCCDKK